jgi:hypothetical protein
METRSGAVQQITATLIETQRQVVTDNSHSLTSYCPSDAVDAPGNRGLLPVYPDFMSAIAPRVIAAMAWSVALGSW